MTKFFTLLAALAALSSSAQQIPAPAISIPFSSRAGSELSLNGRQLKAPAHKVDASEDTSLPVTEVIREAEGRREVMYKASKGFYLFKGVMLDTYEEYRQPGFVVYGDDNDVYFFNILSKGATGSYVKGIIDGDKVTVPLPQTVIYDIPNEVGMNVCVMDYIYDEESDQESFVVSEKSSVTFTIGEDGSMTLEDLGDAILGFAWTDNGDWTGYGDWAQYYSRCDLNMVSMPEGIETEDYAFVTGEAGHFVTIGIDGDDMYIKGLSDAFPEGVFKATIDGNKATVALDQPMGIFADSYFIYTKTAVNGLGEDGKQTILLSDKPYVFNVNFEDKVISSADRNMMFLFNARLDDVYYLDMFKDITLYWQETAAGVPQNPEILDYNLAFISDGYSSFIFNIPAFTTDGNLMYPDKLFYRIFMDGELVEFELGEYGEYYGIPEGEVWTEIPFDISNGGDLYSWSSTIREVGMYPEGFETLGVQSVYRYDGETTVSDIVTLNVETFEITVETGVGSIPADSAAPACYDLSGRRVANPAKGIYIVRSADKTRKIIVK